MEFKPNYYIHTQSHKSDTERISYEASFFEKITKLFSLSLIDIHKLNPTKVTLREISYEASFFEKITKLLSLGLNYIIKRYSTKVTLRESFAS